MLHRHVTPTPLPEQSIRNSLTHVLESELLNLQSLIQNLPKESEVLVNKLLSLQGKVVFSGLGKSGLVARKLAATFSSTGTPAFFIHPVEALHGDIGVVQPHDLFIILSKSAHGEEFEKIIPFLTTQGNEIVLLCCNTGPLAQKATLVIHLPVTSEACFLNLAPTTSTTLMMAFGDAIALATAQQRNFTKYDFARFHPAGTLGKKLLLTVGDIMYHGEALPFIDPESLFPDILVTITQKKLGIGIVVDHHHHLLGVITDGDLRRSCNNGIKVFEQKAYDVMTKNPKSVSPNMLAREALEYMERYNITSLIIVNEHKVLGLIHIHDLIKAGLQG